MFFHEDNILWYVKFDKTEHSLDIKSPRHIFHGQRYHNPSFPCAGNCTIESNCEITGVPLDPLPLFYIFDTNAKKESNFTIDPAWCQGHPTVSSEFEMDK